MSVKPLLVLIVFPAVSQVSNIISGFREKQSLPFDDFFINRLQLTSSIVRSSRSLFSFSVAILRNLSMKVQSGLLYLYLQLYELLLRLFHQTFHGNFIQSHFNNSSNNNTDNTKLLLIANVALLRHCGINKPMFLFETDSIPIQCFYVL